MYSFYRSLNCHTNCHIPEVVPLQLEHLDLVEPVEGEAGDLDQPVLVQLEQAQALQVDEHLRRSPIITKVKKALWANRNVDNDDDEGCNKENIVTIFGKEESRFLLNFSSSSLLNWSRQPASRI